MLEGFEDITNDLTDNEKKLIPFFIKGFENKIGKNKAVKSREIINGFKKKGVVISGARVRKIINYIRVYWLVPGLIATSKGYYISTDREEVKEYCNSLGHREAAIGTVRKRMEEYLKQL